MGIIIAISIVIIIFATLMMYRNNLVYESRRRAANLASRYSFNCIEKTRGTNGNWKKFYDIYDSYPNYDKMMWNFMAWNFHEFYPNYEDRLMKTMDEICS